MITLQERQLQKANVSLCYYTQGDPSKEAIVFIHPAYGDHTCFHHQVDVFGEDYHVISVDMLGHGNSQVKGGGVTIEKTVDLIAEVIQAEGHTQAHLVGVSLGSLMAQAVAHRFPQRVKSITVTGGYSIFGDNSAIMKAQNREIIKAFFLILFWMDGFRRYVVKNTNLVESEREVFYRAMQKFTRRSLPVMSGMSKILDKTPRALPHPLLIIIGEQDLPILLSNARDWQKREPNAQLQIIPNAGHCANMDNPVAFNHVLREFIGWQMSGV
ncbi:MAG: alpha/beta hydrolase [Chloroflexota bacterium]|jgi:pimeloyl-ACP methyl ester carboxylesterase